MYDVDQLAGLLGMSSHQVRLRLGQFRSLLAPYIHRGQKNKVLLDHNGLEILKRALSLEKQGRTLAMIEAELRRELGGREDKTDSPTATDGTPSAKLIETYEKLVAQQAEELGFLRKQLLAKDEQIRYLQHKLDELGETLQRALPPPSAPAAERPQSRERPTPLGFLRKLFHRT